MKLHHNARDHKGQTFGRLTAIRPTIKRSAGRVLWQCICDCGNQVLVVLRRTKSCGCLRNDYLVERIKTHGMCGTVEYQTWKSIKQRCYNKNNISYAYYGGRGIKVCDRWLNSFENFLEDMGEKPHLLLTIDRINNNGHYEPGNCQWATMKTQAKNRSTAANPH